MIRRHASTERGGGRLGGVDPRIEKDDPSKNTSPASFLKWFDAGVPGEASARLSNVTEHVEGRLMKRARACARLGE